MSARLPQALAVAIVVAAGPAAAGPYGDTGYDPAWMMDWAASVAEVVRGPMDIADPTGGDASFGSPALALGPATGDSFDVVSLGDGGHITLWFTSGIGDGPGDDFAVYENGFYSPNGFFGEFAFVEVSSNGVDFARFPSTALEPEPVPDGGVVDPTDYDRLSGKHPAYEGTGFDLAALSGHALVSGGLLDLGHVEFVRIVDAIGDGSTVDASGNPVYDPYPTAYANGGHDLEAIGVLHTGPEPGRTALLASGALLLAALARQRASGCVAGR